MFNDSASLLAHTTLITNELLTVASLISEVVPGEIRQWRLPCAPHYPPPQLPLVNPPCSPYILYQRSTTTTAINILPLQGMVGLTNYEDDVPRLSLHVLCLNLSLDKSIPSRQWPNSLWNLLCRGFRIHGWPRRRHHQRSRKPYQISRIMHEGVREIPRPQLVLHQVKDIFAEIL